MKNRILTAVVAGIAGLAGFAGLANAAELDLQIGSTVNHYQGVVVRVTQHDGLGRIDFGSTTYTQSTTADTPGGQGYWTVVVNGQFFNGCTLADTNFNPGAGSDYRLFACPGK